MLLIGKLTISMAIYTMAMLNNQRVNDDAEKLQRFFKEMADGQIFSFLEMNIAMVFFWGIPWYTPFSRHIYPAW